MSFWSDASAIVKGAIVVGIVGLAYFGLAFVLKFPPFIADEPAAETRGLVPGQ